MSENIKLKNIYLVGPARSGKTLTATILQQEYGYTHIIMDAVIETLSEVAPILGIKHGALETPEFLEFLESYSRNLFKYTKHNIIDLETFNPQTANSLLNKDESTVIYLGYPNLTPQEKLEQIRKFDTEFDWTRRLSDEELLELLSKHIQTSKRLQKEAEEYGYTFIDTSFNRVAVIAQEIDKLIKSGTLNRTEKSYERYRR